MKRKIVKPFGKMTDEEKVDDIVRIVVTNYIDNIERAGNPFNVSECLKRIIGHLTVVFKNSVGYSWHLDLPPALELELDSLKVRLMPKFQERLALEQQKYNRKHIILGINEAAAQALIPKAFGELGLKAYVLCQKLRAKVLVHVDDKRVITFYVSYKKLNDEELNRIARAVLDCRTAVLAIGGQVKISGVRP